MFLRLRLRFLSIEKGGGGGGAGFGARFLRRATRLSFVGTYILGRGVKIIGKPESPKRFSLVCHTQRVTIGLQIANLE